LADDVLLLEKLEGIAIITLNRPKKLNAQNRVLQAKLDQALTDFERDEKVKVIIITGSGDKAFSAGADIYEMVEFSGKELEKYSSFLADWTWHLATCKKPTIAAINGLAYGGGALLASLVDIRLGCERTSFRFLAASVGRVNSTWTLPLIVGWPIAKELIFTARIVEADEALKIGLLNKLFASADLMNEAIKMGQSIATNNSETVQGIKSIMIRDIGMSWQEMLINERQTVTQTLNVPPVKESFKDFLERKKQ
jgi:enoyl-CoA hydratase